jgi:hypothetical protein
MFGIPLGVGGLEYGDSLAHGKRITRFCSYGYKIVFSWKTKEE